MFCDEGEGEDDAVSGEEVEDMVCDVVEREDGGEGDGGCEEEGFEDCRDEQFCWVGDGFGEGFRVGKKVEEAEEWI